MLWRAVYKPEQLKPDGTLKPSFFRDKRGLSCDLARMSSVERSRRGYGEPPPWPDEAGLVAFTVGAVEASGSSVGHEPLSDNNNYSHCQFRTALTTPLARTLLARARFKRRPRLEPKKKK